MRTCITLFLCCAISFLIAQEDLRKDADFFQEQGEVYGQWLERMGLDAYLKVHLVEVDSELVSIYLEPVAPPDETMDVYVGREVWDTVSTVFQEQHGEQLGRRLLYKMLFLFELEDQQANVQFFNSYDLGTGVDFKYIKAWYFDEEGRFQEYHFEGDELANSNKAQNLQISVDLSQADDCSSDELVARSLTPREVYDRIIHYAEERFGQANCSGRNPRVRVFRREDDLRFEADDLCRTVLYDETNSVLCRISSRLGLNCNSIERERLHFEITYTPTSSGFRLNCIIDGKYADTWGRPRRGDYKSMEENPEFAEYLTLFAEVFTEELRAFLEE